MTEQTTEELIAEAEELLRKAKERDHVVSTWLISPGAQTENAEEPLKRSKEKKLINEILILIALLIVFLIGLYGLIES